MTALIYRLLSPMLATLVRRAIGEVRADMSNAGMPTTRTDELLNVLTRMEREPS